MNFAFVLNSLALGTGLAMDAFSVSMANGLHEPGMSGRRMCAIAAVYAVFQYAMPMIGWLCVHTIVEKFRSFERYIPWIALLLLLYIGGKMIRDGLAERKEGAAEVQERSLSVRTLLLQGIATSIDALSVGFTIADYDLWMANAAALMIGGVTFVICIGGLQLGKAVGTKFSWKAAIAGGCILIAVGIEIFVSHLC